MIDMNISEFYRILQINNRKKYLFYTTNTFTQICRTYKELISEKSFGSLTLHTRSEHKAPCT